MINNVTLMGRLTAEPELKQTSSGTSVLSFCLAVDRPYYKDREREADFINLVAWRQTAEFISRYFTKGQMIAVDGRLQTRSYDDKYGNKRSVTEVVVSNAHFCGSKDETTKSKKTSQSSQDDEPSGFDDLDGFEDIGTDDDKLPF